LDIPDADRDRFLFLRYRAMLERALANLAIANESLGAKKEIYLEYAEEVFREVLYELNEPGHPLAATTIPEEATHWLIETYLEEGKYSDAEAAAVKLLDRYKTAKVTRGYFLSRLWYQRATAALQRGDAAVALDYFRHAEEAGKGKVLSVDQKLDLWIQQSAAQQALGRLEEAMLLLSQVVNEDAISGLRLKAMYLRAELYEKQGRRELARKQLEAMVKKGGEWAAKAQQKLKGEYGQ
jgi:tetratricopeptide (TPR) repeat protein